VPGPWRTDEPKVLVVADDRDAGELLARLVDEAGWLASLAFAPAAAVVELAEARPPYAAVVLDLSTTNRAAGLEALRSIRDLPGAPGAVPVVMCSWNDGERAQAWVSGVDGFLTRPFHANALAAEITAAVERPLADRDAHRQRQIGLPTNPPA
jgi:DNA-binding response OmpR family regulator